MATIDLEIDILSWTLESKAWIPRNAPLWIYTLIMHLAVRGCKFPMRRKVVRSYHTRSSGPPILLVRFQLSRSGRPASPNAHCKVMVRQRIECFPNDGR